jgi:hypothetical protein
MIPLSRYDKFRVAPPAFWNPTGNLGVGGLGDDLCGCFVMKYGPGVTLRIIASNGDGWDHISVSHVNRCPTWEEMSWVAQKFFGEDTAIQLHVGAKRHINNHKNCLHWWRPQAFELPLPPPEFV